MNNTEAERSVICSILIKPKAIDDVSDILEPGDFSDVSYGMIFGTLKDMDIGLRLQNTDSNIMKEVMKTATSELIPLLFVHDSAICKYSDRARVKQIMVDIYKSVTGFNIKVTQ